MKEVNDRRGKRKLKSSYGSLGTSHNSATYNYLYHTITRKYASSSSLLVSNCTVCLTLASTYFTFIMCVTLLEIQVVGKFTYLKPCKKPVHAGLLQVFGEKQTTATHPRQETYDRTKLGCHQRSTK